MKWSIGSTILCSKPPKILDNNINSRFERGSGLLLHISSLPGEFGIGTIGDCARKFTDYLADGGQKYWQILPIGPVSSGYSYSPYSSYSSFAGNQLFIDPATLQSEPWMKTDILSGLKEQKNNNYIDFNKIEADSADILGIAHENFLRNSSEPEQNNFRQFCKKNKYWLDDYALFKSLSNRFNSFDWRSWEESIQKRDPGAVKHYTELLTGEITFIKFVQYIFNSQWKNFKNYCNKKNISLIGDIPIYAGMDSADAWANTNIFQFSEDLSPLGVSGVPPDYFSESGQKWGTPLYRWFHEENANTETFNWWNNRIGRLLELVNIVRIDHFRGFESYWSIHPDSVDGKQGKWEKGPGTIFFDFLKEKRGSLPVIAEDLGIITDKVKELRKETGFPGMKILQFAFDQQPDNPYIPENISDPNCIIYTGTHDNNTSSGWFFSEVTDSKMREYIKSYLKLENEEDFQWKFIETSISSIADISIIPLQDLLGLSGECRLNTPGTSGGSNWKWKAVSSSLDRERMKKLRSLCELYKR